MLPAHLALSIKQQVLFYLQSTFDFRDRTEDEALERFLLDKEKGLFKGPWVVVRRPYRPAPPPGPDTPIFFEFPVPFHPFIHQYRAWARLCSNREFGPRSTIVTTGTSSGKTECFLFPILDHCLRMRRNGQQGIKAIVLYPMNALAKDQEGRFAETIWKNPILKAAGIRVGTYTGRFDPSDPASGADSGTRAMGPDHGVSHHASQMDNPPDILLTNYKMLDFLLMRPQDQALWKHNGPGVLRYLVLDELHTYDGAQGADVACLIRRLKERLRIARGSLCVVGTSATLETDQRRTDKADNFEEDTHETPGDRLARFASILFEEEVPIEAVIGEDRLNVVEVCPNPVGEPPTWPSAASCLPSEEEDADRYVGRQATLWGGPAFAGDWLVKEEVRRWEVELGAWVKQMRLFHSILKTCEEAENRREDPLEWEALIERLALKEPELAKAGALEERSVVLASFFALIAQSREVRSGRAVPLLPTQVQLWIRELKRLGRAVQSDPEFRWLDEPDKSVEVLPAYHCSECGGSGWAALVDEKEDTVIAAKGVQGHALLKVPKAIYDAWFRKEGHDHRSILIAPWRPELDEGRQLELGTEHDYLCEKSLVLRKGDGPCPLTGDERRFRVVFNRDVQKGENGAKTGDQKCPHCGSSEAIFFIGSQAATLCSVAIDEMFGSRLNRDPKLLAFTDSVQDASHRAGFFTARTYRFTFRTALQHAIDEAGPEGLPLPSVGERVLEWAARDVLGRPGNACDALAVLMPPDLQEYGPYREFRGQFKAGQTAPPTLCREIAERLAWEATSEFGLMLLHGRTMEMGAASCLGWKTEAVAKTLADLRDHLERLSPALARISEGQWRVWLYGILHRFRLRGALEHPYLESLAKQRFWGKYPFGRTVPGRETFPPGGVFTPKLLVTKAEKGHDFILSAKGGSRLPWQLVWTRRALDVKGVEDATLLDLIRQLLLSATRGGLMVKLADSGERQHYALAAGAAFLQSGGECLECTGSGRLLVRPAEEAACWVGAPSIEYYETKGVYRRVGASRRQQYYQDRYHKGALRRVTAAEHTGLLATGEREQLEKDFSEGVRMDDPNVLTCTSTLEMGINIGDLSSTMLCSIPPSTASYLQRIGRAGRSTGTALIVSVVNQKPHDLFFYARPNEMLKGRISPPGCWLDASAVLARQYLAYCFDRGTADRILSEFPRTAGQLLEDLDSPSGKLPKLFRWVAEHEADLQRQFLSRFHQDDRVGQDTRLRFLNETATERIVGRVRGAVQEFDRLQRELRNARDRLQKQLKDLEESEQEARQEIEQELRLLKGRAAGFSRMTSLELLTDHGLLPNYAFPERGVRFHGGVYNKHRGPQQEPFSVEIVRAGGVALKELAPSNTFYTHRRQFKIQQVAVGTKQDRLLEKWGICGRCGHMRRLEQLRTQGANTSCPQCHYEGTEEGQVDQLQQRDFLEFSRSEALSFMEHYESLSGDRRDERDRINYAMVKSFDQTVEAPVGATASEELPFGIEYRAAMVLREVNGGYGDRVRSIPFGKGQATPEEGFQVCADCGVVVPAEGLAEKVEHRRHCSRRRENEKRRQKQQHEQPYRWERVYLFRELRSEAIRLLLPSISEEEQETLVAAIYLGLRLRFEGDPGHLIVAPQILPEPTRGVDRQFMVLMDSVPGGTGYLKSLYQEKDATGREGEGLMDVMRLARRSLQDCECGRLHNSILDDDPDGCYRCIRSYHLQYNADKISRVRGIQLLDRLIEAGGKRVRETALDDLKPDALFESSLERKFIAHLAEWVKGQSGSWTETSVMGKRGYRFSVPQSGVGWDVELQPVIREGREVELACRPDFLLRPDHEGILPIALFTDGFEFHCHPNNRLADDMRKRRSLLLSGRFRVWAVTWRDLALQPIQPVFGEDVARSLVRYLEKVGGRKWGRNLPDLEGMNGNGFTQLKSFLLQPNQDAWTDLVRFAVHYPLIQRARITCTRDSLEKSLEEWRSQGIWQDPKEYPGDGWVWRRSPLRLSDSVSFVGAEQTVSFDGMDQARLTVRLDDGPGSVDAPWFEERWREFLAAMNLMQFQGNADFIVASEPEVGASSAWGDPAPIQWPEDWAEVLGGCVEDARKVLEQLGKVVGPDAIPKPRVEYYLEHSSDDICAELAWDQADLRIAVLVGDQAYFAESWKASGWCVLLPSGGQLSDAELIPKFLKKKGA